MRLNAKPLGARIEKDEKDDDGKNPRKDRFLKKGEGIKARYGLDIKPKWPYRSSKKIVVDLVSNAPYTTSSIDNISNSKTLSNFDDTPGAAYFSV